VGVVLGPKPRDADARTLELYRQLDLADFVVDHGHKVAAINLWVKGEPAARLPFETLGC
jgi:hypothetical protein